MPEYIVVKQFIKPVLFPVRYEMVFYLHHGVHGAFHIIIYTLCDEGNYGTAKTAGLISLYPNYRKAEHVGSYLAYLVTLRASSCHKSSFTLK